MTTNLSEMFNLTPVATPPAPVESEPERSADPPAQAPDTAAAAPASRPARSRGSAKPRTTRQRGRAVQRPTDPTDPAGDLPADRREGRPASAASSGGRVQIMMYLPEAAYESFRAQASQANLSYGRLALLCIERGYDDLLQVFADRAGSQSRLFSTGYAPRGRSGEPKMPVNLHLARGDLDVIDGLWHGIDGCRSRNDFLSTAVQQHLAQNGSM